MEKNVGLVFHRVIGGNLEQSWGWLAAHNVRETVRGNAHARILGLAHHKHLEIRRVPRLGGNDNRLLVSNCSGGKSSRDACSLSGDAFDRLCSKVYAADVR